MSLSPKALTLLKKIYDHHKYGDEDLVSEDPEEALESVLDEIVETLSDRQGSSAPVNSVTHSAVAGLRRLHRIRREAKQEVS